MLETRLKILWDRFFLQKFWKYLAAMFSVFFFSSWWICCSSSSTKPTWPTVRTMWNLNIEIILMFSQWVLIFYLPSGHSDWNFLTVTAKLRKLWMLEIFLIQQGKGQLGIRKLNNKQQQKLVCGFDVGLTVLNFIVIGLYTMTRQNKIKGFMDEFLSFGK